jgi:[ribosomal protein S5]-alanine N-acetyltransferase
MSLQPTLTTGRLLLRPFAAADAPRVTELVGAWEIADTTLSIPHPYELRMAEEWIGSHEEGFAQGTLASFAVTLRKEGTLVGAVGLSVHSPHARAELGYWFGRDCWGRGYASEAAAALLDFAFDELRLHRVYAFHLTRNPASGRVMRKIGMRYEGRLRQHVRKWDLLEDLDLYGVLRTDR